MDKNFVVIGVSVGSHDLFLDQNIFPNEPKFFLQKKDDRFLFNKEEALDLATRAQLLAKELGLKQRFFIRYFRDPNWRFDIIRCVGSSCISLSDVADRIEELGLDING